MVANEQIHPTSVHVAFPRTWGGRLAYVISQAGSPPVLAPAAIALAARMCIDPRAWVWAGVYTLIIVVAPLLYLVWLKQHGVVTDLDVQVRTQRMRPMRFALLCSGLGWLSLTVGAAPAPLRVLAGALWIQTLVAFGITMRWKISVHCATAASVAALAWAWGGTPLPLLCGLPLIAWSRVRLGRHTLAQTIAGTLLGLAAFAAANAASALMHGR